MKNYWLIGGIGLVLLLAVGSGAFFAGKTLEDKKYQAEAEYNIRLNRSDLDGLGEIDGKIYVTGHKSPDSDTVGSSIAYAYLLRQLGYDAEAVVLGPVNHESAYILQTAGLEAPPLLEDASGCNMILVDHSEYTQSAEGLKDAKIISIIDHHGDGAVTTGNQLIYDARPLGSTATIIWIRYRNYGLQPDKATATAMIGSIFSDTQQLKGGSTTFADREAVTALNKIAGITDLDSFYQNMFKASISYEGMTDKEIFLSDYKEYENGGKKYGIGVISAYDDAAARDYAERMKTTVPDCLAETGMDMLFAQINVYHDDLSISYIVPSDEAAAEVIQTAFPDTGAYDGSDFRFEPGMSRKAHLVPAITDVLEATPGE
ncbi:MAG: DHH family phosphoesterase [Butyrivibrio sp.]|nr:DHH family phosphoesterase [Butyrivibrio sp.]